MNVGLCVKLKEVSFFNRNVTLKCNLLLHKYKLVGISLIVSSRLGRDRLNFDNETYSFNLILHHYLTGGFVLAWTVLWFLIIYDSPNEHPRISGEGPPSRLRCSGL